MKIKTPKRISGRSATFPPLLRCAIPSKAAIQSGLLLPQRWGVRTRTRDPSDEVLKAPPAR